MNAIERTDSSSRSTKPTPIAAPTVLPALAFSTGRTEPCSKNISGVLQETTSANMSVGECTVAETEAAMAANGFRDAPSSVRTGRGNR